MAAKDPIGTQGDLVDEATMGLQDAARKSTVGIVSGSGAVLFSGVGAGSLIRWKDHHLILMAAHVIRETRSDDLRFFFPFENSPAAIERDALKRVVALSASGFQRHQKIALGRVVADEKLDIAILSVDANLATTYPAIFFDVVPGGNTPPEGADILATGFPRDIARATGPGALAVFSHTEWTKVLAPRQGLAEFDANVHFLADYLTGTDYGGANPTGLSGSGAWLHKPVGDGIWHPNLDLAGLTVSWYPKSLLLRFVRREAIEAFLDAHCK